jgi:hypothetical protein
VKYIYRLPLIFSFCLLCLLTACSLFDYDATVPSYITIEKFELETDPSQGTASHQITDVWVYINGVKAGTYELPVTFPVLFEGVSNIEILPGIKLNGISATRAIYSFYEKYDISMILYPDSIQEIFPKTRYYEGITFRFIEDFETVGMVFDVTARSDTGIVKGAEPEHVFEGNYGEITLENTKTLFEVKSIESYALPKNGAFNYLELNYKNTIPFVIGLYSNELQFITMHPIVIINPSNSWKKIYVNLTPVITRQLNAIDFNIFIASELPAGTTSGKIWIDNLKLIHF